jgi:4-hydroxybenzoate polyprenyltransferase
VSVDTLAQSVVQACKIAPLQVLWQFVLLLVSGQRARFKQAIAAIAIPNPALLPYRAAVLELVREAVDAGRPVFLVSGADRRVAESVAGQLGLFNGVYSSDGHVNLVGSVKARHLATAFGAAGFDYVGDSPADLPVWQLARRALVVQPTRRLRRQSSQIGAAVEYVGSPEPLLPALVRCLRPHQASKNLLVLIPLLTAHLYTDPDIVLRAVLGFVAFCLCSFGGYCMNDVMDVESDRRNREKRHRPIASGRVPIWLALLLAALLSAASVLLAGALSVSFLATVVCYIGINVLYAAYLRSRMFLDVIALMILFSLRLAGGHAVTGVIPSNWLVASTVFLFLSLALMKRYTELLHRVNADSTQSNGRAYLPGDLPLLPVMGIACGYMAVLVLALYIERSAFEHYRNPQFLWGWCVLLFYYVSRLWLIANRGRMNIDPVAFAISDRVTYAAAATALAVFALATYGPLS